MTRDETLNAPPPGLGTSSQDSDELPRGSERIIVVEDQDDVLQIVLRLLHSLGYAAEGAADGAAVVTMLEAAHKNVDLVLTDLVMPGAMPGARLAVELGRRWPLVRVMFMTSYGAAGSTPLDASIPLLKKPFRKADLARAVRRALDAPIVASDAMSAQAERPAH